jgi:hypothetical protein
VRGSRVTPSSIPLPTIATIASTTVQPG